MRGMSLICAVEESRRNGDGKETCSGRGRPILRSAERLGEINKVSVVRTNSRGAAGPVFKQGRKERKGGVLITMKREENGGCSGRRGGR